MEIKKIIDILLYFVPATIVMTTAYMLIKRFLDNDYKLRLLELKRSSIKQVLPLRLQAYERICLLLERISPNSLLLRTHKTGMSAKELQSELLSIIRSEFEHNLSQQIYISPQSWEMVKNTREEIVKIINTAMAAVGDKASGIQLSKTILEIMIKNEKIPTQRTLDFIKNEVKQIF